MTKLSTDFNRIVRKNRLIIGLLPTRYMPTSGGKFSVIPSRAINAVISKSVKCALIKITPLSFCTASFRCSIPSTLTIFFKLLLDFQRAIPTSKKPMPSEAKCFLNRSSCSFSGRSGKHNSIFLLAIFFLLDGSRYSTEPSTEPSPRRALKGRSDMILVRPNNKRMIQFFGRK